jgi:hypothetical protein
MNAATPIRMGCYANSGGKQTWGRGEKRRKSAREGRCEFCCTRRGELNMRAVLTTRRMLALGGFCSAPAAAVVLASGSLVVTSQLCVADGSCQRRLRAHAEEMRDEKHRHHERQNVLSSPEAHRLGDPSRHPYACRDRRPSRPRDPHGYLSLGAAAPAIGGRLVGVLVLLVQLVVDGAVLRVQVLVLTRVLPLELSVETPVLPPRHRDGVRSSMLRVQLLMVRVVLLIQLVMRPAVLLVQLLVYRFMLWFVSTRGHGEREESADGDGA